jgi:hypothetical protein
MFYLLFQRDGSGAWGSSSADTVIGNWAAVRDDMPADLSLEGLSWLDDPVIT